MDIDNPIHPDELNAFLSVLEDRGVKAFECPRFKVSFHPPEDKPNESTDVKGFIAPGRPTEKDESPEALKSQHARAFGAPMPLLDPTPPKKD